MEDNMRTKRGTQRRNNDIKKETERKEAGANKKLE
jgi:hypothetical protein